MRGYDAYRGGWQGGPRPMGGYDRGWRPRGPMHGAPWGGVGGPFGRGGFDRYDRGIYGDAYPGFGGVPGGGRPRGYDAGGGYAPGRPPMQRGWGGYAEDYGDEGGYARVPFLPDRAYQRHPELNQRPERGPRYGYEVDDTDLEMDDGEILAAVRQRLYEDVWVDVDRLGVEVEDGIVTLTGEVDDFLEARYAWDDAWETMGVRGVINHIRVRLDEAGPAHGDLLPQSTHGSSSEPSA
ncbi:BON domain-containing protein [Longimicrobium sp.]|uniref:BON domain-containing protein n=1 Tax=Longimicrobium sp. TaxID=2029185 RepID=UPI002F949DED